MKTLIYTLSICLIAFINIQCGSSAQENSNENEPDSSLISSAVNLSETETYYVLASSGLRMRNEPSLAGEKLEVVEYGEQVKINPSDASKKPIISNGIAAPMVKTYYKNHQGYMFKGYLSSIPVPEKGQSPAEYARQLKRKGYTAKFDSVEEEMEAEDILSIPALDLQEAFLIGQRLDIFEMDFDLPSKPNPKHIMAKPDGKTTKIERQEEASQAGMVEFVLPDDPEKSHIYHRMIGLKYDSNNLVQIIYNTAYEGGSWTCSLQEEGNYFVFRKFAVAD